MKQYLWSCSYVLLLGNKWLPSNKWGERWTPCNPWKGILSMGAEWRKGWESRPVLDSLWEGETCCRGSNSLPDTVVGGAARVWWTASALGETVLLIHLRASAGFQCNFIRSYYKVMNRFLSNVLDLTEASIESTPFENPPHPPEPMTNLNPLSDIEYLRLGNRQ